MTSTDMTVTEVELGQALHELTGRQIDLEEFVLRFLACRVHLLSPIRPGLFVMSRPHGAAIVPVWSTIRALRQVMGTYDSLARTGEEVVAHLPEGVGVLIDDGLPCPVDLPSSLLVKHRLPYRPHRPGPASRPAQPSPC